MMASGSAMRTRTSVRFAMLFRSSRSASAPASAATKRLSRVIFRFIATFNFITRVRDIFFISSSAPLFPLVFAFFRQSHGFFVADTFFLLNLLDEGHPGSQAGISVSFSSRLLGSLLLIAKLISSSNFCRCGSIYYI
jgi:hypothetical protein